jgi:hypothetical protein
VFQWTATLKAHFLDQTQSIKVPSHHVFLLIIEGLRDDRRLVVRSASQVQHTADDILKRNAIV